MNDRLKSADGFVAGAEAARVSLAYRDPEEESVGDLCIRLPVEALEGFSGKDGTTDEATFVAEYVRGALSVLEPEKRLIEMAIKGLTETGSILAGSQDEKNRQHRDEIVRASRIKSISSSRAHLEVKPHVSNMPKR